LSAEDISDSISSEPRPEEEGIKTRGRFRLRHTHSEPRPEEEGIKT